MNVRRARAEDARYAAGLMQQLEGSAHGEVAAGLENRFQEMLDLEHHALWVAEHQGRIVGLITANLRPTLWHAGPSALIDELVVDETARGLGVGRALIEVVVDWARSHSASEVEVSTERDNEAAQAFYRRCGFESEAVLLEMEFD